MKDTKKLRVWYEPLNKYFYNIKFYKIGYFDVKENQAMEFNSSVLEEVVDGVWIKVKDTRK